MLSTLSKLGIARKNPAWESPSNGKALLMEKPFQKVLLFLLDYERGTKIFRKGISVRRAFPLKGFFVSGAYSLKGFPSEGFFRSELFRALLFSWTELSFHVKATWLCTPTIQQSSAMLPGRTPNLSPISSRLQSEKFHLFLRLGKSSSTTQKLNSRRCLHQVASHYLPYIRKIVQITYTRSNLL